MISKYLEIVTFEYMYNILHAKHGVKIPYVSAIIKWGGLFVLN